MQTESDIICKREYKIGNRNKWNYCHHFPILPLLGVNHNPPLFHMYKRFIYLRNKKERIDEFSITYMVNPTLQVNKLFI